MYNPLKVLSCPVKILVGPFKGTYAVKEPYKPLQKSLIKNHLKRCIWPINGPYKTLKRVLTGPMNEPYRELEKRVEAL